MAPKVVGSIPIIRPIEKTGSWNRSFLYEYGLNPRAGGSLKLGGDAAGVWSELRSFAAGCGEVGVTALSITGRGDDVICPLSPPKLAPSSEWR